MSLREDAITALTAAGFTSVDLDSPAYADFVATHLSSRHNRSYSVDDSYVGEVVEYSRRPEVIDAAVDNIAGIGSEIGRRKYGRDIKWETSSLKEDLKRTWGRK